MGKIFVLAALIVALLPACDRVRVKVVERNHYVLSNPQTQYLKPTTLTPPPTPEDYAAKSMDEREDLLVRLIIDQYKQVALCNADKSAVAEFWEEQRIIIETLNKKEQLRITELVKELEKSK